MILDLNKDSDRFTFTKQFKIHMDSKDVVNLGKQKKLRSIRQNSYLHICIAICAIEWGNTLDEQKTDLKRECSFMRYSKNDKHYLKRTRDMNSKELTEFIEWIRNFAGKQGLNIPSSEYYLEHQHEINKQIESNKEFL